jgi:uncharacterized membrane protein YGL010W
MLAGKSWDQWITEYEAGHRNPVNRACHRVGIPLIVLSLPLFLLGFFWQAWLVPALALFVMGWILQFVGHVAERSPPEFFHDWHFLLVGVRWWLSSIRDQRPR